MCKFCYELFAQFRIGALLKKCGFGRGNLLAGVKMRGVNLGEQPEHADVSGVFSRAGRDRCCVEVPKKVPSGQMPAPGISLNQVSSAAT